MTPTTPTQRPQTSTQRPQRSGTHGKRVYAALLGGAAVAVALVAALTAWAAQLGSGAWLPVLAPFALVLAVPLATLAWLHSADTGEGFQAPSGPDHEPASRLEHNPASHTTRRVA